MYGFILAGNIYSCVVTLSYLQVCQRFQELYEEMHVSETFLWNPGLTCKVLCEEFITGPEFDIDLLLWNGHLVYSNVVDNWPTVGRTFMETGSNCPSMFSTSIQQQLIDYSFRCVQALGFQQGCFHVECKYTEAGKPVLIEVNARMGGGSTRRFHEAVYGVCLQDNALMAACGIPIDPPRSRKPLTCLADFEFTTPFSGYLLHDQWLEPVKSHPRVLHTEIYKRPGTFVYGTDGDEADWLGIVIVGGATEREAVEALKVVVAMVTPPVVRELEKTKLGVHVDVLCMGINGLEMVS